MEIAAAISLFVVIIIAMLALKVYIDVIQLSKASLSLTSKEPNQDLEFIDKTLGTNFYFIGIYDIGISSSKTTIYAWKHRLEPTFFSYYYLVSTQKNICSCYEFTTLFTCGMLDTNTRSDSQLWPKPPASYTQSFSKMSIEELYEKHRQGSEYLMRTGGARPDMSIKSFEENVTADIRKKACYFRTFLCWPLIALYNFFVGRHLKHNKSIEQQHSRKMIRLPNELTGAELNSLNNINDLIAR